MSDIVKIRVIRSDRKPEKLAIPIRTGTKIPFAAKLLGIDTPYILECREDGTWLTSAEGADPFTLNGRSENQALLRVGDLWEHEGIKVEFLILPVIAAPSNEQEDDRTRYMDFAPKPLESEIKAGSGKTMELPDVVKPSFLEKQASEPAPSQTQSEIKEPASQKNPDESSLTLFHRVFQMKVPEKFKDVPPDGVQVGKKHAPNAAHAQTRGAPDTDRRGAFFKTPLASKAVVVVAVTLAIFSSLYFTHKRRADQIAAMDEPSPAASSGLDRNIAAVSSTTPAVAPVGSAPVPVASATPVGGPSLTPLPSPASAQNVPSAPEGLGGRDPHEFDPMAKEEFFSAVRSNDLSLVAALVQKRIVDVNYTLDQGRSALHAAAIYGNLEVVRYLLSKRANINAKDASGTTPLMWAVFKRQKATAKYLAKRGADLTARRDGGDRAIDIAKRYGLRSYFAFLTPKSHPNRKVAGTRSHSSKKKKRSSSLARPVYQAKPAYRANPPKPSNPPKIKFSATEDDPQLDGQ